MKIKSFMNTLLVFMVSILVCTDISGQSLDTLQYKFDFQVGGQRKRGIFSQTSLRATSINELENKKLILNNLSSYSYTEVNGNNIADDWHFRTILMFKLNSITRLLLVFAHNYLKNVLYRISNSNRALAGVRIIPIKQYKSFSFILGAGYEFSNYSNEVFINSPFISNQRDFSLAFFNVSGKHQIGKLKILLQYNFSSVQSFKEANDYSFWLTSGVSIPLGKNIHVGVNYDYRFRNIHLKDIPKINDLLLFNVKYTLSN